MKTGAQLVEHFLGVRTLMIILHASQTVRLYRLSCNARCMSVDVLLCKKFQLIRHPALALVTLHKTHGLPESQHSRIIHILHHIGRQKLPASVCLHIGCRNRGRNHEENMYQRLARTFQKIIHSLHTAHIDNLVRIRNNGRRSRLHQHLGQFARRYHTGFNMHMGIQKSRYQIFSGTVDLPLTLVGTDSHDRIAADCHIRFQNLLREYVQYFAVL